MGVWDYDEHIRIPGFKRYKLIAEAGYIHIDKYNNRVDVRTISSEYARNLFWWYERKFGCFGDYSLPLISELIKRGNVDI